MIFRLSLKYYFVPNSIPTRPALIGSVRIETCHGCHIFIGPCMTSVYLENNTNCLIQVSCHQLRIHLCQQVRMYVRVNSHPIIEDCEGMLFAPLLMTYAEMNADIQVGLVYIHFYC